jgi:hypothetical protein
VFVCTARFAPDNFDRCDGPARIGAVPGRLPTLSPRDDLERRVIQTWRASGRRDKTIAVYLNWVRLYRSHCNARGLDEVPGLTLREVIVFAQSYSGRRRGDRVKDASRRNARSALRAWSCALKRLDIPIPEWRPSEVPRQLPPLMKAYVTHRRCVRGVAESTLVRDIDVDGCREARESGRTRGCPPDCCAA